MSWIMDTYSPQKGHTVPGVVNGQADRDRWLARPPRGNWPGVLAGVVEACRHLSLPLEGARVVVQGYGNVVAGGRRRSRTASARA